jgi:hypothetical protein
VRPRFASEQPTLWPQLATPENETGNRSREDGRAQRGGSREQAPTRSASETRRFRRGTHPGLPCRYGEPGRGFAIRLSRTLNDQEPDYKKEPRPRHRISARIHVGTLARMSDMTRVIPIGRRSRHPARNAECLRLAVTDQTSKGGESLLRSERDVLLAVIEPESKCYAGNRQSQAGKDIRSQIVLFRIFPAALREGLRDARQLCFSCTRILRRDLHNLARPGVRRRVLGNSMRSVP